MSEHHDDQCEDRSGKIFDMAFSFLCRCRVRELEAKLQQADNAAENWKETAQEISGMCSELRSALTNLVDLVVAWQTGPLMRHITWSEHPPALVRAMALLQEKR